MSIYGCTPEALITEVDALAPFMDYSEGTEKKLKEMGVINKDSELNQGAISTLATVFASNFNDCYNDFYVDGFEILDIAFDATKSLFAEGELIGSYIYLLLCCGMTECCTPYELIWLARREDILTAYLKSFIEAMALHEVVLGESVEK